MDLATLRQLLRQQLVQLKELYTHTRLPELCAKLGLPPPPEEGSKWEKIETSFYAVSDAELSEVAERLLQHHPPLATVRNQIQDILWDASSPPISKKCRREVARAIGTDLYLEADHFDELLDGLWVLENEWEAALSAWGGDTRGSLRSEIQQHIHRNPEDWNAEQLFGKLGAFEASDRRFALFVEGLASSDVRPDVAEQRRFVEVLNGPLRECHVELRETGEDGGYPVFSLVALGPRPLGRPKNLIFASPDKPDLRFRDAVDNNVEVVSNPEDVLMYDRPIGGEGLRWRDLQAWWSETRNISDPNEAKRTLYRRLQQSLPASSPPQRLLFEAYHQAFRSAVPNLPALLPEVWLHWDPKTVAERGPAALLRFRMDFLMLFPGGLRIVLEVDGRQHYADEKGQAKVGKYATMVAADRELKLAGYEVFRFGGTELDGEAGEKLIKEFFVALFRRYGVAVPKPD